MIRSTSSLAVAAGLLALTVGIGLRLCISGSFAHFASGFFLGVSIALLILGLARPSRDTSR
jgi:hypothetical protein